MLKNLIRVSGVLTVAGALIASAGASQNQGGMRASCTGPNGESGFVNGAGVCQLPPGKRYRIEALVRAQTIEAEKPIDGLTVAASPMGAAAWKLRIQNGTDDSMSILWDESSFVTSDGRAAGRLVRGETRKLDIGKAQPPDPVPPHAELVQIVFAEKLIDMEGVEERIATTDLEIAAITQARKFRANRNALLVGGKMHVAVTTPAGKQTWTGVVVEAE